MPNQLTFACSRSTIERLEKFEICSRLKLKTPERRNFSSISIVNFELVNVSWEYSFSKAIYKLLNKKGKFMQTQMKYNEKHLNHDIDNFHKRIRLSSNFGPNDVNKKQAEEDTFKPPSNKNWLPKNTHYTIETFIDLKSKEIDKKKGNKIRHKT